MRHRTVSFVLAVVLCLSLPLSAQGNKPTDASPGVLTVYAYDSFVSEWGPGPAVVADFEQQSGWKVDLISVGNASELLRRVILEQNNPKADVVVGIPHGSLATMLASNLFMSHVSAHAGSIPELLQIDPTNTFIPFDYGNFSFVYDSNKIASPPRSLDDLLDNRWKGKVILMDPRTSSVGMGLLEWTIAVYGERYLEWWKAMKPNILTIADSWSSGYGLFTQGEAPLVISYTTSPVYHVMFENNQSIKATVFPEGNGAVIEGIGIVKSSDAQEAAKQFVDFLLGPAQATIAVSNVMYPANIATELPEAFVFAPKPDKSLMLPFELLAKNRDRWLTEWVEAMSR